MLYDILKDDLPENTISNIKRILSDIGIEVEETYNIPEYSGCVPCSIRLNIKNTTVGVNGKGTSLINARASAYAEFIERLQNFQLFKECDISFAPDVVTKSDDFLYGNQLLNQYFSEKLSLMKSFFTVNTKDIFFCLPFYSVLNDKVEYLPSNLLNLSSGSNGLAAGNTFQEACLQSLSEICERYSIRQVFLNKIKMPLIPDSLYKKYKKIVEMIEFYNNHGFNVTIRDASLGKGIPVVCTIFENTKKNMLSFSFGSHPSLPIAIERTLTEFIQGVEINDYTENPQMLPFFSKVKFKYSTIEQVAQAIPHFRISFEKNHYLVKQFFNSESNYVFDINTWNLIEKPLNQTLLTELIKKISKISNAIFIRDVSFLGFPSVHIFIPGMSEVYELNQKKFEQVFLYKNWSNYSDNDKNTDVYNINSLFQLASQFTFLDGYTTSNHSYFKLYFEYIAFLCAIVMDDVNSVIKYSSILLDQAKIDRCYDEEQIISFKIIRDYYKQKKRNISEGKIIASLSSKYDTFDIQSSLEIIQALDFDIILNLSFKKKEDTSKDTLEKLRIRLCEKYKNNVPDQLSLRKYFCNIE